MLDHSLIILLMYFSASVAQLPMPTPITVPHISFADLNTNKKHLCNETWAAQTNMSTGEITLDTHWRGDEDGICDLAHELTHYLQFTNKVSLKTDIEPPAYRVDEMCYKILFNHKGTSEQAQWAKSQQTIHKDNKCTMMSQ